MSKIYLRTFLDEMTKTYKSARADAAKLWDELAEAETKYNAVRNSRAYSAAGKAAALETFNDEKADIHDAMTRLVKKTERSYDDIRERADAVFADLYRVCPEQVDANALELLKADVLTDAELVQFGERFRTNPAMSRLCGRYAARRFEKHPDNRELRLLAAAGENVTPQHLEALDTLRHWAANGLRPDNRPASDAVAAEFDDAAARISDEYGNIETEV